MWKRGPFRPSQSWPCMVIQNPYWIIKCTDILLSWASLGHSITVGFAELIFTSLTRISAFFPKFRHYVTLARQRVVSFRLSKAFILRIGVPLSRVTLPAETRVVSPSTPNPTPPPHSPRRVCDPNVNSGLILQRNRLKLSSARKTRGKSCLGYPLPHKWALDEIFVCLCSLDNLSLILTAATWNETQVKWNSHLPRSERMFSHLLCTDGYTHMCRILQCLYMKRNGCSRVHRWRTRQLLGVIRNTAKLVINKERSLSRPSCSHMAIVLLYLAHRGSNQSGAEKDNGLLFREQ